MHVKAICKQQNNENIVQNVDFCIKFLSGSENVCFIFVS